MPAPMPTDIRGTVYPSMTAAAKALGVCVSVVQKAIDNGTTATVGLYKTQGRPRANTYLGVSYPSIAAASAATGHSKSKIYRRLKKDADK